MEPRVVSPGFRARVEALVRRVPRGEVTTYGAIAAALGSPRVARHVGWALAAVRDPEVPWHRVVNAQGRIAFKGDLLRAGEQRRRLEAEGIVFDGQDRIDLRRFRNTDCGTSSDVRSRSSGDDAVLDDIVAPLDED